MKSLEWRLLSTSMEALSALSDWNLQALFYEASKHYPRMLHDYGFDFAGTGENAMVDDDVFSWKESMVKFQINRLIAWKKAGFQFKLL